MITRSVIGALVFVLSVVCPGVSAPYFSVTAEQRTFPAKIDGRTYTLQSMLYRPAVNHPLPLIVFSHGRNGPGNPYDARIVFAYSEICRALAHRGYVVAYVVRRGYGDSEGPDRELQDTPVQCGLEAAKDYRAAVEYWSEQDFVLPGRTVIAGQSQGGWAAIACATQTIPGVLGTVNISGGTNFRLMGKEAYNHDQWVRGCAQLGQVARVPSYWIYAENDLAIPGPTARQMHAAYTKAGGKAELLMLPAYGRNGHDIVGNPSLFLGPLMDFLHQIGATMPAPRQQVEVPRGEGDCRIVNLSTRGVVSTGENVLIAGFVIRGPSSLRVLIRAVGKSLGRFGVQGTIARPQLHVFSGNAPIAENGDWRSEEVEVDLAQRSLGTWSLERPRDPTEGDAALLLTLAPGAYTAVVSPHAQSANHDGVGLVEVYALPSNSTSRLINISSRGRAEEGARQMIVGVVLVGVGQSRLMVRGVGPGLKAYGIAAPSLNPRQTFFRSTDAGPVALETNDDWWDSDYGEQLPTMASKVGAFALKAYSADSVVLRNVTAGAYSSVVSSSTGQPGIVLTEIYDAND
jgi:dienelactone hydrolase